jgi:lysozyme
LPPYLTLALGLIKRFEGYSSAPYEDATGTWTIGYGFTTINNSVVKVTTPSLTQPQADQILTQMLTKLDQMLGIELFHTVTDHQRAALLSLAWNIGMGNLGHSTLLKYVNDGAMGAAASQFLVWTYSKGVQLSGLTKRRQAEMLVFQTPDN